MDLCGVRWECGEKANGDPATGNAREEAPWYEVWTGGHDYGGISNYNWLLFCITYGSTPVCRREFLCSAHGSGIEVDFRQLKFYGVRQSDPPYHTGGNDVIG